MYAVIFKAVINELDEAYVKTASRMRELAMTQYGCTDFVSVTEGAEEISISYWQTLEQIQQWKQNTEHLKAQSLGRKRWYKSYQVQIVEVVREYGAIE